MVNSDTVKCWQGWYWTCEMDDKGVQWNSQMVGRGGIEPVKWMTRMCTVKQSNGWQGWYWTSEMDDKGVQWNSQMVDRGGIEPVKWMTEVNQAKGCMDR